MSEGITIRYCEGDGYTAVRNFDEIEGAREYAQELMGLHPEEGTGCMISHDGLGKIECFGCTLADLFPEDDDAATEQSK